MLRPGRFFLFYHNKDTSTKLTLILLCRARVLVASIKKVMYTSENDKAKTKTN